MLDPSVFLGGIKLGRFAWMLFLLMILILTGCSHDEGLENGNKTVTYSTASESLKLTQAKALPVLTINPSHVNQKESLEVLKLQHKIAFYRGSRYEKQVALTFDDGPDNYYTLQILDILKREHIKATFFVVGRMAQNHPDSLRKIYEAGHTIGNHSWNHPEFTKLSKSAVEWQIASTNNVISSVIGRKPILFRPPYGAMNNGLEHLVAGVGFKIIYWDVDTVDWNFPTSAQILQTVKKELKPGSIILQHCAGDKGIEASVQALPSIIAYLRQQGYQFVTVDQLIHSPAYAPQSSKVITPKRADPKT